MMVAGFGFRGAATVASLADALAQTGQSEVVDALATLADKVAGTFEDFASDRPVIAVTKAQADQAITATTSPASLAARSIASVAEATALAAVGPGGQLLGPRVISEDRMATCAIAVGTEP